MNGELLLQLTIAGVVLGSFYALLGVSFGLVYQTSRIFHLANSVPFAVAGYTAVWSAAHWRLGLWQALLLALVAAVAAGLLILVLGYLPLIGRGAPLLSLFIVSLGISVAFPNLLQIIFGPDNVPLQTYGADGTLSAAVDNPSYSFGFVTITRLDLLKVVIALVVVLAVLAFVNRTRFGRAISALRTNPVMAEAVGINSKVIYLVVFGLGSLISGICGLFVTAEFVASPNMAIQWTLIGFVAVFFGGIGSLGGTAVGGLVLGLLTSLSSYWLGVQWAPVIAFAALFIVLLVRPQGLFGKAAV